MEKIKLTETVLKGGCAAKVPAHELRKILSQVRFPKKHSDLLVDGALFDDAAIYKFDGKTSMVQTLDFFTPIVDSPSMFGRIAAANALSDVYAMGGRPKTCMAILAFPTATMGSEIIAEVLQGASDIIGEANANFVGGHSIDDDTLKFGLSVTGFVSNDHVWSNDKAQVDDVLILTKALGTGTCTAALKRRDKTEDEISEAIQSMCQLNNVIDYLSADLAMAIHSATDITGFGLSGHSMQMASASKKTFHFNSKRLPFFSTVPECLEKGFLTKAHRTNREYTESKIRSNLSGIMAQIIHDPQTSGGLLLSVAPDKADAVLAAIQTRFTAAARVGLVGAGSDVAVVFD